MHGSKALPVAAIFLSCAAFSASPALGQRVLSPAEVGQVLQIKDLQTAPTEVSGMVVNNTPHVIRDVEILIEYHWRWTNEFKPGMDSPGRVAAVKLDKELSPGQSAPFRYVPSPPLPNRQDGRFDPEVVIAGFTTVVPATTTSR